MTSLYDVSSSTAGISSPDPVAAVSAITSSSPETVNSSGTGGGFTQVSHPDLDEVVRGAERLGRLLELADGEGTGSCASHKALTESKSKRPGSLMRRAGSGASGAGKPASRSGSIKRTAPWRGGSSGTHGECATASIAQRKEPCKWRVGRGRSKSMRQRDM